MAYFFPLYFIIIFLLLACPAISTNRIPPPGYECLDDSGQPPASDCQAVFDLMKSEMLAVQQEGKGDVLEWLAIGAKSDSTLRDLTEWMSKTPKIWEVEQCSIAVFVFEDKIDYFPSDLSSFSEVQDAASLIINGCVANKNPLELSGGRAIIGLHNLTGIYVYSSTSSVNTHMRNFAFLNTMISVVDYLTFGLRHPTWEARKRRQIEDAAYTEFLQQMRAQEANISANGSSSELGEVGVANDVQELRRKLLAQQSYCTSTGDTMCGNSEFEAVGVQCKMIELQGSLSIEIFGVELHNGWDRTGLSICGPE
ncbi:MAG: hypothetical protein M1827_006152 [Pycnora praestabilis]|nr:MAG: hypothetical protein M1827_006152 [Pycnora praestabilis]